MAKLDINDKVVRSCSRLVGDVKPSDKIVTIEGLSATSAQCHDANWGKRLLAETISQGHGNAFPAYRLEWQTVGSLQRRIRACYFGIRAEMPAPGARGLTDLELFLAWRAQGLPMEAPGVRR